MLPHWVIAFRRMDSFPPELWWGCSGVGFSSSYPLDDSVMRFQEFFEFIAPYNTRKDLRI